MIRTIATVIVVMAVLLSAPGAGMAADDYSYVSSFKAHVFPLAGKDVLVSDFEGYCLGRVCQVFTGHWKDGRLQVPFNRLSQVIITPQSKEYVQARLLFRSGEEETMVIENQRVHGETRMGSWESWLDNLGRIVFVMD